MKYQHLVSLALAAALLTGCGGTQSSPSTAADQSSDSSRSTPGAVAQAAQTDRNGDAPVDAAVPLEKPGAQQAGKDEAEQRRAHGRMGGKPGQGAEGRNQQNAAHAHSADEPSDKDSRRQ